MDPATAAGSDAKPKRQRKSRSRGLRTKTGCLTCRKRHKKCDEQQPICGPCSLSNRDCVYGDSTPKHPVPEAGPLPPPTTTHTVPVLNAEPPPPPPLLQRHNGNDNGNGNGNDCGTPSIPAGPPEDAIPVDPALSASVPRPRAQRYPTRGPPLGVVSESGTSLFSDSSVAVPSEFISADLASTRWLDQLATDAAEADSSFSLRSSSGPDQYQHGLADGRRNSNPGYSHGFPEDLERLKWQSDRDIELDDHESVQFRNFAERNASWLDLFDPYRHFSTYAIRLALRNRGLMRAILALSARHASLASNRQSSQSSQASVEGNNAIQYYHETLQYMQSALAYNSYAHSEELLGTVLTISTYEMLSESDSGQNWQRHLEGVFLIQSSQDVNGSSGGLRQAVWWAWLRQDIWAAFREKRRCFSFWKPEKGYGELTRDELACQSVYLLSQAVNYAADCGHFERTAPDDLESMNQRAKAGDELFGMLEQWKSYLGDRFRPLPSARGDSNMPFRPIWIHPPHFGVAVQVTSWARILVALHRPSGMGPDAYRRTQKILSDAVSTICGIAMDLTDEGSQIMSAQCLYGAGLCVHEPLERSTIISLIGECEARSGWPMSTWQEDLRTECNRHDSEYQQGTF